MLLQALHVETVVYSQSQNLGGAKKFGGTQNNWF